MTVNRGVTRGLPFKVPQMRTNTNRGMARSTFQRGEGISAKAFFEQGGFYDVDASDLNVGGVSSWKLSAVYRCIAAISETIASLPFNLMVKKDGGKYLAENFYGFDLYATDPNKHLTWFEFFTTLIANALNDGNGYALIKRDAFAYATDIQVFTSNECTPYVDQKVDGSVEIHYWIYGKMYNEEDVIHIKCLGSTGYVGESILQLAKKAIQGGMSQQEFNHNIFANGLNLQGTLEAPDELSEEALEKLEASMTKFRGAKKSNGTMILEEGIKYNRISVNPIDAQFVENRIFTVRDICRFFGVPLHKVMDLEKATNNNIEQQDLEFYKACIMPWIVRIEQQFNKKLLSKKERRKYFHQFEVSQLLRADFAGRAKMYDSMFPKGAITPDEIRKMENFNPMGDEESTKGYMQLAMSQTTQLNENRNKTNNNVTNAGGTDPLPDDNKKDDNKDDK